MKLKTVETEYTAYHIWTFHGETDDGQYFVATDDGMVRILNADPEIYRYECWDEDWQMEHLVEELENEQRLDFCDQILDFLTQNEKSRKGMKMSEIQAYREYFKRP